MINKKRIAKNTLFLYVRMIITMTIGLYSVRIVLQVLGETDYGIYNVVGGVITMLAFLNNALASTTQRFLSFELGQKERGLYREVFNTSLSLYMLLCAVLLFLGETIGLWFVNNSLVIPSDRTIAANCVYQCSIASFIFTVLCAPYNAAVVAHEKMSFFAYVSIIDACCKLGICISLLYVSFDKLMLYSVLMMAMSGAVFITYIIYCRQKNIGCRFHFSLKKKIVYRIVNFAGWSTFGALSNIFRAQGINFLLNIFFGPIVNAARGIAYQAEAALLTLIQNFYIAVRPQAIKSYADGAVKESIGLVFMATKIGYMIMLVMFVVFMFETDLILGLWIEAVPDFTIVYFRIILVAMMMDTLITPITMLIHANGHVMNYQLLSGLITASSLLIAYIFIKIFGDAVTPMLSVPIVSFVALANVLYQVKRLIPFPVDKYICLLVRFLIVTLAGCVMAYYCRLYIEDGIDRLIIIGLTSLGVGCMGILFVMDKEELKQMRRIFQKKQI